MDFLRRTWVEIDTNALKHNFEIIKAISGDSKVMAVVKANAYGHHVDIVAPLLQKWGADAFAVSNIEEAIELRNIGINKPILILGYTPENYASKLAQFDITQCVYSSEYAKKLSDFAKKNEVKVKIHIKLDTGMGRIGFNCRSDSLSGINEAIESAKLPNFIFDGIFTHFAVSDRSPEEETGFTDEQYERFVAGVQRFNDAGMKPNFAHCCNSAAICLDGNKHLDMCRAGVILYGLTPSTSLTLKEDFVPVMTFKTVISMIKTVNAGETVSYGRTYTAKSRRIIATLPVGYADGYNRLLSNRGYVLINGKKAPVTGRVCMDQMAVDITGIDNLQIGDEVILFGKELPVEEISDLCGTINYETVCAVSARVKRIPV
ncbi:MAG TPA: alanine racemase [Ruminococcaceae bacterium]|nr:alanine racemase [Oscillospiraceae bacterium]